MPGKLSLYYSDHRQKIWRIAIWAACLVTSWAVLAGLIMPPILRQVAEDQLAKHLGSACTLQKVRFNPFTLRLTAENLRIPLPDGAECFRLGRFEVRLSPAGMWRLAPVLSDLRFIEPLVEITLREDGTLSVTDLGRTSQQAAEASAADPHPETAGAKDRQWNLFGIMVTDLEIRGGQLHFRDDIRRADHTVADLELFVPFTSTLNRHRERAITPYLEAVVNGRPLRVDGRLAPFAEQLHTEFDIRFDRLDLTRFQPYLAPLTQVTLQQGRLTTELVFSMRQQPEDGLRLGLSGQVTLANLEVAAPDGAPALRLPRLGVELDGALNTPEGMTLKTVTIQGPEVYLALLADGRLDWLSWLSQGEVQKQSVDTSESQTFSLPLHLERFELRAGRVVWQDQMVKGGFRGAAEDIGLTVTGLHLPGTVPAALEGNLTLNGAAMCSLQGTLLAQPLQGDIQVRLDGLPLADFQPYVAASGLPITLQTGALSGAGRLELASGGEQEEEGGGTRLYFKEGEMSLQELSLLRNDTRKGFFRLGMLALADLSVDVNGRQLEAKQLLLKEPDLSLRRDRQGIIDLTQLQPAASGRAASPSEAAPTRPWQVRLAELKLDNGQVAVALEGAQETTRAVFYRLTGSVTGFDSATRRPLTVTLRGREKQGGSLALDGQVTLDPLELNGRLRTDKLNLKPFSPLLGQINPDLRLGAGTLSLSLQASLKNAAGRNRLRVRGQSVLESLSLLHGKQEFAALRTLRVPNLDIQPDGRHYATGLVTLTRPHINLIMAEDGVSNLARLFGKGDAAPADVDADAAADAERPEGDQEPQAPSYLRLGGVQISEGRVLVRDERYEPAVANRLDKLAVTVGAVDNAPDSRASVAFSAELNGAALEGKGVLNPLGADMFADVQTQLAALDLTPLSPMSERFIAYPLQKGSFSLNSTIKINQGRLDSRHRIELDGLELGDKVDSPDAPNLPVKLGIKLLRDAAGNIDLTLPVHGELQDPSFSVGGLVLKVIGNLLVKAVASPFMFLSGLIGGDGQGLEYIAFDPGEGRLLASYAESLPTIADMLTERPEIQLVLKPEADEEDRAQLADAYVRRRLQELKHADLPEQERAQVKAQELPVGPEVDADEYAKLLFEVYADQPFDKPRNLFGMVRRLPPQEMMEKIREHYPRDDAALKQLALERAGHLQAAFLALRPELEGRISVGEPQVPGEGHRVSFGIK